MAALLATALLVGCQTSPQTPKRTAVKPMSPKMAAVKQKPITKYKFSLPKTVKPVPRTNLKTPQPVVLTITIDPYVVWPGGSNAVITVYKSTWLGTVGTPFKPTAVFPATRTNQNITVVSGQTYMFYSTATVQPWGESDPSVTSTNKIP